MAPVIRDLGGLEGEVKNAGECRGYVRTQGFKSFSFLLLAKSASCTLINKNFKIPIERFSGNIENFMQINHE